MFNFLNRNKISDDEDNEKPVDYAKKLRDINYELNKLENIAMAYNIDFIPHNLDKQTLFEIDRLHEKVGKILVHLYNRDTLSRWSRGELTQQEALEITKSVFANYQYSTSTFIDSIEDDKKI